MYNSPLQRHGRIGNLEGSRVLENTLNAATIRNHEQIIDIAKPQEEGELPKATYHRQCRSIFTLERNLDKLSQLDAKERENCNSTDSRRSSIRQPTANPGRIYQRVCIFCEKDKYTRNSRTGEEQCVDMHADETIRKAAAGKCDNRILAVISRELVVAEARYRKSCYRNQCTRNIPVTGDKKEDSEYTEYFQAELQGYDNIRTDLLQNLRILRLSELYALPTSFVNSQGEREMQNRITSIYSAKSLQPRPSRSFLSIVWKSGLLWSTGLGSAASERCWRRRLQSFQRTTSRMWSAKCKIPRHHKESQAQDLCWPQQEDKS